MKDNVHILLADGDADFAKKVEGALRTDGRQKYTLIWRQTGSDAIAEMQKNPEVDIIVMEYFLMDQTGLHVAQKLYDMKIRKPIIFLTINKDFDIVVEMMKFGVKDYIVKDESLFESLPKVITRILEHSLLEEELMALEITKQRLEAMKDLVSKILREIEQPTVEMKEVLQHWDAIAENKDYRKFLHIIKENVSRIMTKIDQLRTLNTDKTIKYIKDIRMIDLS